MYKLGSFCLGLSMLWLQGCSDSNVEAVRDAKYDGGKHKVGVVLDRRKECDDQKWESMADASDNVTVTVLCTFELSNAVVERAMAVKTAEVAMKKESLLQSYARTRQQAEASYQDALEAVGRVNASYERSIATAERELEQEKAELARAQAAGEQDYLINSLSANVEYLVKEVAKSKQYAQENRARASDNQALRKSQVDYLISIEKDVRRAADDYADAQMSAFEDEFERNTRVTNLVAFERLASGPKLSTYKTVARARYATKEELLDRQVPTSQTGAMGLAVGLRSADEARVAAYFTEEAQKLRPGFYAQVQPEPFSCSIYKDGVKLCVFEE